MLGGGFLGHMHETTKKNRELVQNVLHRSREKAKESSLRIPTNPAPLPISKTLTEHERSILRRKVLRHRKQEIIRAVLIITITGFLTLLIVSRYW